LAVSPHEELKNNTKTTQKQTNKQTNKQKQETKHLKISKNIANKVGR
jgi:hypothetical protein